jgi:hypothetical protein
MGRPIKKEDEKAMRITFSLYPEAYRLFKDYKKNMDITISDSAAISYLIRTGIKYLNGDYNK